MTDAQCTDEKRNDIYLSEYINWKYILVIQIQ